MSHIGLIDYKLIIIDYIVVFETMIVLFRSLYFNRLQYDIIDYFSFYKCFISDQEYFNRLQAVIIVFSINSYLVFSLLSTSSLCAKLYKMK